MLAISCTAAFAQNKPAVSVTVEKGDCLIRVCNKYLEKPSMWKKIAEINKLKNPDVILPGQTLLIPAAMMKGTPVPGTVTFLNGTAEFLGRDTETWAPLALGDKVEEGWLIRTGSESSLEIKFEDGNVFLLKPDTTIGLQTARRSGDDYSRYKMSLKMGRMISNVQKATGKESAVQIEAPTAVLGVRGTVFRSIVLPDGTSRFEVIEGEVVVEGARETVEVRGGEGTIVRKDAPPIQPKKLLQPPALATAPVPLYRKFPVRLSFEEVADAVSYRIAMAKDSEVKNIVKEKVIGAGDIFEIADVEDGTYFMQTSSIDELGIEGMPSEILKINIRVNPLPPFVEMPVDEKEYKSQQIICKWLKVSDAKKYHVQIAEDWEFQRPVVEHKSLVNPEYSTGTLDYKTYYFRVSSVAADNYQGEWSDPITFTLLPPPASPPVEEPEMDKNAIRIRWQDLGKDVSYRFQMAKSPEFKEVLIDSRVETPEITIEKPTQAGTYHVRISGVDSENREGNFSKPQSFEIKRSNLAILGFAGIAGLLLLLGL